MKAHMLQRKCACGGSSAPCKCPDKKKVQRSASAARTPETIPPIVHRVLTSSGQTLDRDTRAQFEPRFGVDFSAVRIHADAEAAESARAVNANAYTVGQDVVFAAGQYAPQSTRGARLLAHELTHVVQQRGTIALSSVDHISMPHEASEVEADRVADRVVAGQRLEATPTPVVQLLARQAPTKPRVKIDPKRTCEPKTGVSLSWGCYCGRGNTCGNDDFSCAPMDALDECCRIHDYEYGKCNIEDRLNRYSPCYYLTLAPDKKICQCALRVYPSLKGKAAVAAGAVIDLFCPRVAGVTVSNTSLPKTAPDIGGSGRV